MQHDHRGIREVAFYEAVQLASESLPNTISWPSSVKSGWFRVWEQLDIFARRPTTVHKKLFLEDEMQLLRRLSKMAAVPTYYGLIENIALGQEIEQDDYLKSPVHHLVLHDVTFNYVKPCVIDLKMGTESFEPDASAEKRRRERKKYPRQRDFGFRIVGMRVYDPYHPDSDEAGYRQFDKLFGRSLIGRDQVVEAFRTFFSCESAPTKLRTIYENKSSRQRILRSQPIYHVSSQLKQLWKWFDDNHCFRFHASSLLLVYEGNYDRGINASVKMIDHGRVRRFQGGDSGYKLGISTLLNILDELIIVDDSHTRLCTNTK
jgi:1D-myo-inositol-tetrakisphosphate 5-kinase/inositol-polyphosphate multikinase